MRPTVVVFGGGNQKKDGLGVTLNSPEGGVDLVGSFGGGGGGGCPGVSIGFLLIALLAIGLMGYILYTKITMAGRRRKRSFGEEMAMELGDPRMVAEGFQDWVIGGERERNGTETHRIISISPFSDVQNSAIPTRRVLFLINECVSRIRRSHLYYVTDVCRLFFGINANHSSFLSSHHQFAHDVCGGRRLFGIWMGEKLPVGYGILSPCNCLLQEESGIQFGFFPLQQLPSSGPLHHMVCNASRFWIASSSCLYSLRVCMLQMSDRQRRARLSLSITGRRPDQTNQPHKPRV